MINALARFSLKGSIAIVTGGTSGIGKTTAEHLASAGADVAIISRHLDSSQITAAYLADTYGVNAHGYACDVACEADVEATVSAIADEIGTPNVLFNNAGINVNGIFLMARAVARRLVTEKRTGSIINTASISASIVNLPQWQTAYNTSKAAVLHMTKTLAVEWAEHRIRVNAISPGYVWTEMNQVVPEEITRVWMEATPFHRFATTDEIASAVVYFASEASSYATGSELIIDGGFTCL